jgi:3-deoxy-manno-octulosonate cytidylyltransferase (CMP-KDO synthetase)
MEHTMKSIIVIPARYGSTRLPGKALADINGKPLIQWVYERACESRLKDDVLIATDDVRIGDACRAFGAPAVMTGTHCTSGTDRVYEAVRGVDADIVVNLQGDEPQIRGDMIDTLIRAIELEGLDMATLCAYITEPHDYKSPHVAKVVLDRNGFALYFSRAPLPFFQKTISIPTYRHIGIYAFSRQFLETFVKLPVGQLEQAESLEQLRALEAGYRIKVLLTDYEGIGVDTENDLAKVRELLK